MDEMKKIVKVIRADWEKYQEKDKQLSVGAFFKDYFSIEGFHYTVIFRIATYYRNVPVLNLLLRMKLKKLSHKFGIVLPIGTQVGEGLAIAHFGGIVINRGAIIGEHCYIRPNIIIGEGKGGCPCIGNHVSIGAGAIIIGSIIIGNNATIGAGSVVVHNVLDNETVVGNPAKALTASK